MQDDILLPIVLLLFLPTGPLNFLDLPKSDAYSRSYRLYLYHTIFKLIRVFFIIDMVTPLLVLRILKSSCH
jgi:hypothetical protein